MFKRFISALAAGLFAASAAFGQVGGGSSTPGGTPVAQGAGSAPVLSACGTSPSMIGIANNQFGRIQMGGGAITACTITWALGGVAVVRGAIPTCVASAEQAATTLTTLTPSTASLIFTFTSTTAGILDYHCDGV